MDLIQDLIEDLKEEQTQTSLSQMVMATRLDNLEDVLRQLSRHTNKQIQEQAYRLQTMSFKDLRYGTEERKLKQLRSTSEAIRDRIVALERVQNAMEDLTEAICFSPLYL